MSITCLCFPSCLFLIQWLVYLAHLSFRGLHPHHQVAILALQWYHGLLLLLRSTRCSIRHGETVQLAKSSKTDFYVWPKILKIPFGGISLCLVFARLLISWKYLSGISFFFSVSIVSKDIVWGKFIASLRGFARLFERLTGNWLSLFPNTKWLITSTYWRLLGWEIWINHNYCKASSSPCCSWL